MDEDAREDASMGKVGGQEKIISFNVVSREIVQVHVSRGF